ncbi:hypothetical protein NA57DRAFT_62328 [Rhizodiscina lignyota]|uniref:Uncharacterized protein n=1 Tax=Rhizodiscina lignyota TaxID=1504668 RepID=A0A9P4I0C3_9PEZI|nr:hypothetical protein NA57DRAFT_62328 [Rhizodiscina lignyota]
MATTDTAPFDPSPLSSTLAAPFQVGSTKGPTAVVPSGMDSQASPDEYVVPQGTGEDHTSFMAKYQDFSDDNLPPELAWIIESRPENHPHRFTPLKAFTPMGTPIGTHASTTEGVPSKRLPIPERIYSKASEAWIILFMTQGADLKDIMARWHPSIPKARVGTLSQQLQRWRIKALILANNSRPDSKQSRDIIRKLHQIDPDNFDELLLRGVSWKLSGSMEQRKMTQRTSAELDHPPSSVPNYRGKAYDAPPLAEVSGKLRKVVKAAGFNIPTVVGFLDGQKVNPRVVSQGNLSPSTPQSGVLQTSVAKSTLPNQSSSPISAQEVENFLGSPQAIADDSPHSNGSFALPHVQEEDLEKISATLVSALANANSEPRSYGHYSQQHPPSTNENAPLFASQDGNETYDSLPLPGAHIFAHLNPTPAIVVEQASPEPPQNNTLSPPLWGGVMPGREVPRPVGKRMAEEMEGATHALGSYSKYQKVVATSIRAHGMLLTIRQGVDSNRHRAAHIPEIEEPAQADLESMIMNFHNRPRLVPKSRIVAVPQDASSPVSDAPQHSDVDAMSLPVMPPLPTEDDELLPINPELAPQELEWEYMREGIDIRSEDIIGFSFDNCPGDDCEDVREEIDDSSD